MKLRAHHLLCLQGFRGLGYSPQFIQRMTEVKEKITTRPDLSIEVTNRVDVICEACPHRAGEECRKEPSAEKSVRGRDHKVLKVLGLAAGENLRNEELSKLLHDKFPKVQLEKLCLNCQWFELCSGQEFVKVGLKNS